MAEPSLSNTARMGHWSSAALLLLGAVSVLQRGVRCDCQNHLGFTFHAHLFIWSLSGLTEYQVMGWNQRCLTGGCQVVHLRFKKKKHFKSAIRVGWVSGVRRLASVECWGSDELCSNCGFFTGILYIFVFIAMTVSADMTATRITMHIVESRKFFFLSKRKLYCYILVFWGQTIVFLL